jgi:hypothetical protein
VSVSSNAAGITIRWSGNAHRAAQRTLHTRVAPHASQKLSSIWMNALTNVMQGEFVMILFLFSVCFEKKNAQR